MCIPHHPLFFFWTDYINKTNFSLQEENETNNIFKSVPNWTTRTNLPEQSWPSTCIMVGPRPVSKKRNCGMKETTKSKKKYIII